MKDLHSLLRRQIKRFFGLSMEVPHEFRDFINAVNSAYLESDIERGMLERALDLSSKEMLQINAEMRAVFQALPDMLFVIDENGTIMDHKAGTSADVYCTDERRLVGKSIQDIPFPQVGKKFSDALEKVRAGNSLVSFEYALPLSGKDNAFEARIVPVMDNRLIIIVRNITVRVTAEENLRKERDFNNSLVQGSPAFFVAVDPSGKVMMMNTAMLNAIDYTEEEVKGAGYISTFIPESFRSNTLDKFRELANSRTHMAYENGLKTKSGRELLVEWHVSPVLKNDGTPYFFFGVGVDITDRKHLEDQLRQAHKMEAIGTLAGGIAHDFNNLLMGIQGRTSLMLMDVDISHPHHEHLKGIEDLVKSATGLTRQLLGFAMGGKYEVRPKNINSIIKKSSEMFGRTRKEIMIHTFLHEGVWTVEIDQGQIEQVLLNLFLNAGQAMPGGGDIILLTENVVLNEEYVKPYGIGPGRYIKLQMADTGMGMDKDTRERIFDPFFTTKGPGRGTGLGLPSAYGIIKNHGGIIQVESEKGKGSTFTIYLPASSKLVSKEALPKKALLQGKETILLIDDEDMILDVGKQMIESLGYKVIPAMGGKTGVSLYSENRAGINLVILDMIMPEMPGSETFAALKELDPEVKVLLCSGYSLNGQAKEILGLGCMGFIQKPFNLKEISIKLRSILDQGR